MCAVCVARLALNHCALANALGPQPAPLTRSQRRVVPVLPEGLASVRALPREAPLFVPFGIQATCHWLPGFLKCIKQVASGNPVNATLASAPSADSFPRLEEKRIPYRTVVVNMRSYGVRARPAAAAI